MGTTGDLRPDPQLQALPIPVAVDRHDRRPARPWHHRWVRSIWPAALGTAGVALAAAGITLLLVPRPLTVGLDASGYRIGSHRLAAGPAGTYTSAEADLVIVRHGPVTTAAASSRLGGQPIQGRCDLQGTGEFCTFRVGARAFTAEDVPTTSGWHRRYSDGQELDIHTSGPGPIPVPFPIGK